MSQFDKDDVEDLGLLKLDILGIRMQSSMAHALTEIERVGGGRVDIDALDPYDDADVYAMISRAETLGCFQIESPGQRELVGKFGARRVQRPHHRHLACSGPARSSPTWWCRSCAPARLGRGVLPAPRPDPGPGRDPGVVVFHEQVIKDRRGDDRLLAGLGRRGPPRARLARGPAGGEALVLPGGARARLPRTPQKVWGSWSRSRPSGSARRTPPRSRCPPTSRPGSRHHHPAAFLAGRAHPRPGHVPQAADPRRGPPPRRPGAGPGRQHQPGRLPRRHSPTARRTASGWR
jgi:error-prone DNA polymerase